MSLSITSLQNPRVKEAAKLRSRRGRDQQGRIIIDGLREIRRAIDAGVEMVEVFVCSDACGEDGQSILKDVSKSGGEVLNVSRSVLKKLAFGDRAEGMVAVARRPQTALEDLQLKDDALIAVLERVEKPGNVGAVLRTADAAGVDAMIVADAGTDLYNPNAIRASLGAIFTIRVVAAAGEDTLAWLRQHGVSIAAARVDGAVDYTQADYRGPCALVLGSESAGLTDIWGGEDITAISLPMLGCVDSLNVSATAAVLFYEARRQRSLPANDQSSASSGRNSPAGPRQG